MQYASLKYIAPTCYTIKKAWVCVNMNLNKAFAIRVSELLNEKKMSKYQLEKKTGLSHSALRYIFNETNADVKLSTVAKVVYAFDMTFEQFFNSSVFDFSRLDFDN